MGTAVGVHANDKSAVHLTEVPHPRHTHLPQGLRTGFQNQQCTGAWGELGKEREGKHESNRS
jgi:hypothetical protein